jgi:tRNA(fMet)-specific endonuclease VapC
MDYLLDTNICIYLIKRQPPQVVERFSQIAFGDASMSVVTYAELCHGVERCGPAERAAAGNSLARLVDWLPVIPFGPRDAESYGVLAAAVRERRRDALDRLIAAHALSLGAVLVTNNQADFAGYPNLRVENWIGSA